MIRYPITKKALEKLVVELDAAHPNKDPWLTRAKVATKACVDAGKYVDQGSLWGEIKTVYMRIQRNKCCYCERPLPSAKYGKGEHDVEHFRPKSEVRAWADKSLANEKVKFSPPIGKAKIQGYHLLAFHVFNYATSCRTCNSALKRNGFPIAGKRNTKARDPTKLKGEKAYLLFPVGSFDADPSKLIEFEGVSPRPKPTAKGFARQRALVNIAFFRLDDAAGREELFRARAEAIDHLVLALEQRARAKTAAEKKDADRRIELLTAAHARHTSCTRNYLALHKRNPKHAAEVHQKVKRYLDSVVS